MSRIKQHYPDYRAVFLPLNLSYKNTKIGFYHSGAVIIEGNYRDAAIAVFNFMKEMYLDGFLSYSMIGGTIRMYFEKEFILEYEPFVCTQIPNEFIELKKEFDKIKNSLMVFI